MDTCNIANPFNNLSVIVDLIAGAKAEVLTFMYDVWRMEVYPERNGSFRYHLGNGECTGCRDHPGSATGR